MEIAGRRSYWRNGFSAVWRMVAKCGASQALVANGWPRLASRSRQQRQPITSYNLKTILIPSNLAIIQTLTACRLSR